MMPPGHVAVTWAAAQWEKRSLDFRWLAFCALLADLIDKPLALLVFKRSHSSQNVSHALLPNLLVLLLTWRRWPRLRPYLLAFSGHLLADRQWRKTETFWWPLYGWQRFWQFRFMNTPKAMVQVYLDIIRHHPGVWLTELLACLYLGWFGWQHRLYQQQPLRHFLKTGKISKYQTHNQS